MGLGGHLVDSCGWSCHGAVDLASRNCERRLVEVQISLRGLKFLVAQKVLDGARRNWGRSKPCRVGVAEGVPTAGLDSGPLAETAETSAYRARVHEGAVRLREDAVGAMR